jgi:hypothetical protein
MVTVAGAGTSLSVHGCTWSPAMYGSCSTSDGSGRSTATGETINNLCGTWSTETSCQHNGADLCRWAGPEGAVVNEQVLEDNIIAPLPAGTRSTSFTTPSGTTFSCGDYSAADSAASNDPNPTSDWAHDTATVRTLSAIVNCVSGRWGVRLSPLARPSSW